MSTLENKKILKTKKYLIRFFSTLFLYSSTLSSQTLIPSAENAFDNQLPFNTTYIKSKNIQSITFDILDKKDLQVAEDKGLLNYYQFNTDGKLTRFYYTTIAKTIEKEYHVEARYHRRKKISNAHTYTKTEYIFDTTAINYFYNDNKLLKLKRYNDGFFYEGTYYSYDKELHLEKEARFKETNVSETKSEFKLGTQSLISEEYFKYIFINANQYKKVCLNDEGRSYKEIIYNINNNKQITSINEQYTVAWITQQSNFTYNTKGQLTGAVYKSNSAGDVEQKRTYDYDANDCLLTEKHYKNDILQKEISYVTDTNKQLNSYIIRDAANKTMRIVKLLYHY